MLQSFDRGILILDHLTGEFRVALDERLGEPVNIVQVVVSPAGGIGASGQSVVDYVRSLYADRPPPDLIVAVAGPASVFAREHRQQLFPETPLLFAAMDERWLRSVPLRRNESAVPVSVDFPAVVDGILQVLPETRNIFIVNGSGPIGRFWRQQLEVEFARFGKALRFTWSDSLSLPETIERSASLPSHSAIIYLMFGFDAKGGIYADERVLAKLHSTANAPLFAAHTSLLGHGIVGGRLIAVEDLARSAAEVTIDLLQGRSPESLRLAPLRLGSPVFDHRELQRWRIPETRLPAGSEVRFRAPGLWEEYRAAVVLSVAVVLVQSMLIVLLLYERRARRRAEIENRRHLALAADANRRETMSALSNSIGHELGQPVTALLTNTEALRMMLVANQSAPAEYVEVLTDIQAEATLVSKIVDRHRTMMRKHQMEKKLVDLRSVVDNSLALLLHEIREDQVEVAIDMPQIPCLIDGDDILLQQVVVNLVRNALDAMAETAPARRRLTIRCAVGATDLEMSVADCGSGLPPEIMRSLFQPFSTTKIDGLGIGLAVSRSIVETHGGSIEARENDAGGATFVVRLPLPQLAAKEK